MEPNLEHLKIEYSALIAVFGPREEPPALLTGKEMPLPVKGIGKMGAAHQISSLLKHFDIPSLKKATEAGTEIFVVVNRALSKSEMVQLLLQIDS